MATELPKYQLVPTDNNTNIVTELKGHFSIFRTKKSTSFIYSVIFIFILVTIFLAFSPSSSSTSSSSWFINFFNVNNTYPLNQSPLNSSRSHDTIISVQNFTSNGSLNLTNTTQVPSDKVHNFELNATNPEKPINQIGSNLPQDQNFELTSTNNDTNLPQISTKTSPEEQQQQPSMSDKSEATKISSEEQQQQPNISDKNEATKTSSEEQQQQPNKSDKSEPTKISQISSNLDKVEHNGTNNDTIVPQISTQNSPVSSAIDDVANTKNTPQKEGNLSSVVLPKIPPQSPQSSVNATVETISSKGQEGKGVVSNISASLTKKPNSLIGALVGCDLYDGEWVRDDLYPLYKPGSCKFIDEQFNCKLNGRPDDDYQKLKWKPKGCTLPRLKGRRMLNLLRNKRLVFVGDSLNRNMWESLVCILKNSVKNPKNVHEAHGRRYFRNEASYSFVFEDYNCTVEFFVAPFLVRPWEVKDKIGTTKETLRLDVVVEQSEHFKTADIIVFNTGHWWTHEKTSKGEDYYQEGSKVYKQLDVKEAFQKAITTWGRWVDKNINPQRTHVFFRGYSNTHFHGRQWNSGGQCDSETEPIRNETYLTHYPWKMKVFEMVMSDMKVPISFLNITRMTDYRKDAHPSVYRKLHLSGEVKTSPLKSQDCSHWCLPGVPDLWNELLYAEMLRKKYQDQQQKT